MLFGGLQSQANQLINPAADATSAVTQPEPTAAILADSAAGGTGGVNNAESTNATQPASQNSAALVGPTSTSTPEPPTPTVEIPTATPEPPTPTVEIPTATPEPPTPTVEIPTATPEPPTPTVEIPTATPEPPTPTPAPIIAAANCSDPNAAITSPGVNQVVNGVVPILGSATNPQMNFYKLEYAPGANAEGGFGYFDGTSNAVQGGVLGRFNSAAVPNGSYTVQLTVVDTTGNYPTPCRVTIQVQN